MKFDSLTIDNYEEIFSHNFGEDFIDPSNADNFAQENDFPLSERLKVQEAVDRQNSFSLSKRGRDGEYEAYKAESDAFKEGLRRDQNEVVKVAKQLGEGTADALRSTAAMGLDLLGDAANSVARSPQFSKAIGDNISSDDKVKIATLRRQLAENSEDTQLSSEARKTNQELFNRQITDIKDAAEKKTREAGQVPPLSQALEAKGEKFDNAARFAREDIADDSVIVPQFTEDEFWKGTLLRDLPRGLGQVGVALATSPVKALQAGSIISQMQNEGATSYDQSFKAENERREEEGLPLLEYSEEQKNQIAGAYGAAGFVLEKVGLDSMTGKITGKVLKNRLAKVLAGSGSEGFTESLQGASLAALQNKLSDLPDEEVLGADRWQEFVVGAVVGAAVSGATQTGNKVTNSRRTAQERRIQERREEGRKEFEAKQSTLTQEDSPLPQDPNLVPNNDPSSDEGLALPTGDGSPSSVSLLPALDESSPQGVTSADIARGAQEQAQGPADQLLDANRGEGSQERTGGERVFPDEGVVDRRTGPEEEIARRSVLLPFGKPEPIGVIESKRARRKEGLPPDPNTANSFDKAAYSAASTLIERGGLPKAARSILKNTERSIAGFEAQFGELGKSLVKRISRASKVPEGSENYVGEIALTQASYRALKGDVEALATLPADIAEVVSQSRKSLDLLSERMISEGVVDGVLAEKVADNMGNYLLREFRVFNENENWNYETVKEQYPEVYEAAMAEIQSVGKENDSSFSEKDADLAVREMLDAARATSFINGTGKIGNMDTSSFIKRKDLSPAILDLLGEIRDPAILIKDTGSKQAKIVINHASQGLIRQQLLDSGLLSETKNAETRHFVRVGGENVSMVIDGKPFSRTITKKSLAGFGESYTTPELAEALKSYFDQSQGQSSVYEALGKTLATVTGTGKFMQVILNPASYPTNLIGGVATEIFNGRMSVSGALSYGKYGSWREKSGTWSIAQQQELYGKTGEQFLKDGGILALSRAALNGEMEVRGIRDNSVMAEDVNQTIEKGFSKPVQKAMRKLSKAYQAPDNAAKRNAFAHESMKYARAYPKKSVMEIMNLASEDVRATTQNYDMVPQAMKELSQRGVILPTYLSFTYELVRNTVGTAKLAATEIRSDNSELRKAGFQRIAGMLTVGAALGVLNSLKAGLDDDQEEALNDYLKPEWLEGQSVTALGFDGTHLRYFDPSYLIPQQLFFNVAKAALEGDSALEKGEGALGALLNGFGDINIFFATISETIANHKRGGGEVYNEEVALNNQAFKYQQIAKHFGKSMFTPGFLRTFEKMKKAKAGEIGYAGSVSTWDDLAANLFGIRPYTLDVTSERFIEDKLRTLSQRASTASSFDSAGRQEGRSPEEREQAVKAAQEARAKVAEEIKGFTEATKAFGVTQRRIDKAMREVRMPKDLRK